jgi:hypothetical protein
MQRYGNRLLGYWENKEAEERNTPSTSGVGLSLPTEDQVKQAQALAKATPTPATTASSGEEDRSASKRDSTESRPSSTRPSERDDRSAHSVASRGTSFDNVPTNGQQPTSAITTA